MNLLPALLLAAAFDGEAAARHAAALAALGPHPWGSPRTTFAARYVAAQLRQAGLSEVSLQEFEANGLRGTNAIGVLRAPGAEFLVLGAHHDTAPDAPGAYDDGAGVGVLIEAARVLAREGPRARTVVFASFDGEEAWAAPGGATTTGSRAYLQSLGPGARNLVAAFVVEMCGWKGGTPSLHPIAYADPLRPGGSVVAPAWLVRAAQTGAQGAGVGVAVGDPLLGWLYQPAVRTFRVRLYGDDLPFLQAGHPALFVSDSSFSAYYPWYHQAADTADKLDDAALARMGQAVLGVLRALDAAPRGPSREPVWFAALGRVFGAWVLFAVGALALLPGLLRAVAAGGSALLSRPSYAALVLLLLWRHPVPALWVFVLPSLLLVVGRFWLRLAGFLPALALAGIGVAAWGRGMLGGLWLAPWELALAGLAVVLALLPAGGGQRAPVKRAPRPGPRR